MVFTQEKLQSATNYLALSGVSWEKFEQIESIFSDMGAVKFIYSDSISEMRLVILRENNLLPVLPDISLELMPMEIFAWMKSGVCH